MCPKGPKAQGVYTPSNKSQETISTVAFLLSDMGKGGMMAKYIVIENTPGYLPESEPIECESFDDAMSVFKETIRELLDSDYNIVIQIEGYAYLERNANDLGRVIEITESED